MFGSALFAFNVSFDEVVVTLFISGVRGKTLPVKVWDAIIYEITPILPAISTLIILTTLSPAPLLMLRQRAGGQTLHSIGLPLANFTGFTCVGCHATYGATEDLLLCPVCHNLLEANYDLAGLRERLDRDAIAARPSGVWRWLELLPVLDPEKIVTLGEGGTPLLRADRLAKSIGVRELWLKSPMPPRTRPAR